MGTRHLICVVKDGEYKVAQYGQWDGYPGGQGLDILEFLTNKMDRKLFENRLDKVSWLTDKGNKTRWTRCGADKKSNLVSMDIADKHAAKYPENSRDTGAGILPLIQDAKKPIKLINSIDFSGDSLFCEWAYVIDLDKNVFEVYEGFNKTPISENERFASFKQQPEHRTEEHFPIRIAKLYNLNKLPTSEEFLSDFKDDEEE